ncbi:hypothetical protein [Lyngbya confervoides]|uniref:SLC26A/SulP transporter domain-containing protein n=1 Tax=Lyngbya confervoides BDU141951 TaxID=1574623 RepID=A0ABD4T267_9CYAN|nr:hypothetical protein [Lyngbya confervoides]MCM1982598.1 hypothetical protein [Lyngbya confervoides BDU141951]
MRLTILNRFLQFLELLERTVDFISFLWTPVGLAALFCLISYPLLLAVHCSTPTAAILGSVMGLVFYAIVQQPDL